MSAALRLVEGLNSGRVQMDASDQRTDAGVRFAAALLRPIFMPLEQRRGATIST